MTKRTLAIQAIAGAAAAAAITVLAIPASATTRPPPACTRAWGQCQVTEYILVQPDGTHQVWTCYAQPPVRPGASDVWIAVDQCQRP